MSKALVSNWRTGKLKPQPPERAVLERVYGIPSQEWDVIDMSDEAELEDDGALVFDEDAPPLESTLRMLDQQLQRLANGATDEDFKQAEGIRKMLATRFSAEKDKRVIDAYIERALVNPERQPFYQRTVNAVVDALKPHPRRSRMCWRRWMRRRKGGRVRLRSLQERFDEKWKLDPLTGCWMWTAYCQADGYGTISAYGGSQLAHRVSYALRNGTGCLPPTVCVRHSCANNGCVNPDHLYRCMTVGEAFVGENGPRAKIGEGRCRRAGVVFDWGVIHCR